MILTAAQHQREIDHASDVELDMERIEQDMRETLMEGQEFPLTYRRQGFFGPVHAVYDRLDVINAMVDLDEDGMNSAIFLAQTDPIAAAEQLGALMKRAVEQVIGLAPIREAAEFTEDQAA